MIQKLLNKAISYLGAKEPTGDDQFIEYYNKITGAKFALNVPWCAIFVTVIARLVGVATSIIPNFASCDLGVKWFKDKKRYELSKAYGGTYTPKPGDVIFYSSKYTQNDSTHTGYVVEITGVKVKAIEGNKSDAVGYRTLSLTNSYIIGYGRVADFLEGGSPDVSLYPATYTTDPKIIWDFLIDKIGNPYGVAGLMGNLRAESALKATNLQNSSEKKLSLSDEDYTKGVDDGSYTNFVKDSAGYGLAQWTYWSRKQALLTYVRDHKGSIGNLILQLGFLYKELSTSYRGVLSTLKSAKSVREASDIVLTGFERPANQSESVKKARASYGQEYYNTYAIEKAPETKPADPALKIESAKSRASGYSKGKKFKTTSDLNVRVGAGTSKTKITTLSKGTEVTWYGYYTTVSGVKWYLISCEDITGYVSSKYLA